MVNTSGQPLQCMVDFCVIPMGVGTSVSKEITECRRVLERSGLSYNMHSYGTTVEGEWDEVMRVVRQCHDAVHAMGCERISTTMKVGTRTDKKQSMQDKLDKVEELLKQ
ncbi:hypothetical protein HK101_002561 [Irineochytrium annulatum]|nr:hypothetical protein HK101_002561 [Irineochytrium annulatum]